MEKKTLFDILDDNREIQRLLIESEGELTEEIEELIAINRNDAKEKIQGYYYVMEKFKKEEEFLKEQETRLASKRKGYEKGRNNLKSRVDFAVATYGDIVPKSKALIPSKFIEIDDLTATAIAYPVIDPETLKLVTEPETQLPEKYVKHNIVSSEVTKEQKEKLIKLAEEAGINIKFSASLDTSLAKADLKDGIKIPINNTKELWNLITGEEDVLELKLENNYQVRFK